VKARIRIVTREGLREIAEVAIDVDVVLVGAAQMREPIRIHGVAEEDGDAAFSDRRSYRVVLQ